MKFKVLFSTTIIILAILGATLLGANRVHAVNCGILPQKVCDDAVGGSTNDPTKNPNYTATSAITPIVNFVLGIMVAVFGSIILLIIVVSAVQITASGGNEETIKKAKENIFKAVTGLVLLLSFQVIVGLVNALFGGSDGKFLGVQLQKVNTSTLFDGNNLAAGGIPAIIGNATIIASAVSGVAAVVFIIIGGFQYITSAGRPDGLKRAKNTITYALAGLVISISAFTILIFIQNQLQK